MRNILLIDGNNLMFRAYYALPPLRSLSGKLCNAVYGFCNMLISAIEQHKPDYILVAFDKGKKTFRHKLFADYKAQRHPTPEDLIAQFPIVKEMLDTMGVKYYDDDRYEADDILGCLSSQNSQDNVIIMSGDRDLLQLVDKSVSLQMNKKGDSEFNLITPDNIVESFGVRADQVVDLKALMGDTSDNIPGVAGVGEKTALNLIHDYDNLDNVYAHIDEIKGKLHEKLLNGVESAKLSKTLATIDRNCDLPFNITDCTYTYPFGSEVRAFFTEYNFNSLLSRSKLFAFSASTPVEENDGDVEVENVETKDDLSAMFDQIYNTKQVAICYLDKVWHFSFSRYYEYTINPLISDSNDFVLGLKKLLENNDVEKILFDAKEFMHMLSGQEINNFFDLSIAIYLIEQSDRILNVIDGLKLINMKAKFVATDMFISRTKLIEELQNRDQKDLYYNIELPLVKVLYEMEEQGFKVDKYAMAELNDKYTAELKEIEQKIYSLVGNEFNINSPQQVSDLLFNQLQLKYRGKKSTSADVLEAISDQHPVVKEILRYRKVNKLLSTYISGFLPYLDSHDKVHTTFMQSITSTGRLASRSPNLQNIPVRDDEGKTLRKLFVSSFPDGKIVSADYNQIELRLMAHFSQDKLMLADFNAGHDIHSATASKVFGVPIDQITPKQRRIAKTVNFGIIYGISEYGLAKTLDIKPSEAKEFIAKYFETFPAVKECMNNSVISAKEKGYSLTLFNRRRYIPELSSSSPLVRKFGERVAINAPLQGTASDIIKIAMLKVSNAIKESKINSRLILQIHDELIVDCYPGEEEIVKQILQENMNDVVKISVPLKVEVSMGKSWFDCK